MPDLRKQSCEYISGKEAVGNAIGGLSVGEPEQQMYDICAGLLRDPAGRPAPVPDGGRHALEYPGMYRAGAWICSTV